CKVRRRLWAIRQSLSPRLLLGGLQHLPSAAAVYHQLTSTPTAQDTIYTTHYQLQAQGLQSGGNQPYRVSWCGGCDSGVGRVDEIPDLDVGWETCGVGERHAVLRNPAFRADLSQAAAR
ncbi:hypothetical protein VOLCADRAFT_101450, partial [Volvox carteri f. nagariensis]